MAIVPQEPRALAPITGYEPKTQIEKFLRDSIALLYNENIRPREAFADFAGMPHLGPFELIERLVTADGLALIRKADKAAMIYLFKAWRSGDTKEGLHFLRTYLQMLWPNAWEVHRLWQAKNEPYPTSLATEDELGNDPDLTHYLTFRVTVNIDEPGETGQGIKSVLPSLRSVIGSRFMLLVNLLRRFENIEDAGLGFASGGAGSVHSFMFLEGKLQ